MIATGTDIEVEIGGLADLGHDALRARWRQLYGSEPPSRMSRELITRAVAFRLQEECHGGLSRTTQLRLRAPSTPWRDWQAPRRTDRTAKPGTRFVREWNGRLHEAIAMADGGYLYCGVTYRSLSAVARQITGTRWSGPAFFGLRSGDGQGHRRRQDG